jgi:tetratricopeptide (TPR) repeat protein
MQHSPEVESRTNNQTSSQEKNFLKLAQEHRLSAEVALAENNWHDAKNLAQRALEFLYSHQNREISTPSDLASYLFIKSSCLFILAQAQEQSNEILAAIDNLEAAKQIGINENNPYLYISILNSLQRLYKQQKQYLEAFSTKLEQRSIEQKYGLQTFIGAGSLEAKQQAKLITTVGTQLIASQEENIAPEITASGRQKDVEQLLERIGCEDYKLIIIYGKAGVGKSSLLNAGLIPALKKQAIATQDNLVDFSRDLENPSPNLSPARREALKFPPPLPGKGARGLGQAMIFPHDMKSQDNLVVSIQVYDHWIEELAQQLEQRVAELEITEDTHTQEFTDTENKEGRRQEAEGRRFLKAGDSTPTEGGQLEEVGLLDPCCLRSRASGKGIPSASCPLPSDLFDKNLSSELETSTLEFEISALELEISTSKLDTSTLEVKTLALELATLTSEIEILTSEFETLISELEITPDHQTFSISPSPTLPKFHFLLEQLHYNHQHNLRTVLIFDQFEEFFLIHTEAEQRRQFFEFLGECLNILSVKVILSLRENYLHHLLAYNDLPSLEIINNDILSKNILYKLGNLAPADAKTVTERLTTGTRFQLEPALIEQLVQDLAGKLGEVRPIDLQILGAQLQTENITTLAEYHQYGEKAKEKLIQHYLNEVIEDCGRENQKVAELILYFLTDAQGSCLLKTRAELERDLQQYFIRGGEGEQFSLDLVLQILVKSGIVVLLREHPADRYQLAYDHLIACIRQQQQLKLTQLITQPPTTTDLKEPSETVFNHFSKHMFVGSLAAGFVFAVMGIVAFKGIQHSKNAELSEMYLIQGEKLAREGNFEGAVSNFQKAQEWNAELKFDSKAKTQEFVNKAKAERLLVEGQQRLQTRELEGAVAKFQAALKLDTQVGRLAAPVLMYEGNKFMKEGKIKQATIAYINAQNLDPKVEISADAWRELCLQGSLKKLAADVMPACENAVQLAADNQKIRVVRGLARALTGNKQGAIEDFEAYIAATDSKTGKLKARRWIKDLRTGRNPFTDKKLKRLLGKTNLKT